MYPTGDRDGGGPADRPPSDDPSVPWSPWTPPDSLRESEYPSLPTQQPTTARGEPSHGSRRGWWTAVGLALAGVLVAGGILLGVLIARDATPARVVSPAAEVADRPAVVAETDPPPADSVTSAPGPVTPADGVEPVVAVADAVAPSVVLIDTGVGQGSGIIFDRGGHIVTNAHVVRSVTNVVVQLADGTRVRGEVVGADPRTDVAVVTIETDVPLVPATFAGADTLSVGQLAVAIGSPFGLDQTVTSGVVSALNRVVPNELEGVSNVVGMIQTDAPINPGNSGGALADRKGRVIGMNTAIRTDGASTGNIGVGFAIPSDTVLLIADRILTGTPLDAGYLGISGENPAVGRPGALVVDVVPGDPAAVAGLRSGDLIVGMDGTDISSMSDLAARIRLSLPGDVVELVVVRDNAELTVTVTLGSLSD